MKKIILCLLATVMLLCSCNVNNNVEYEGNLSCNVTIKCDTILDNMEKLDSAKAELVPADGIILENERVFFNEGATVFDIITVACKKNKIILNTKKNTGAGTFYIEGINNLIYGDCGDLSGWMFFVNGESADKAADKVIVKEGDNIEWLYTCDMGNDL